MVAAGGTVPLDRRVRSEKRVEADAPKGRCVPSLVLPCSLGVLSKLIPGVLGLRQKGQPRVREVGRSEFLETLSA